MLMGGSSDMVCGWSWEENKLFEQALALVDEQDPNRWEAVAAIFGGKKSIEEVQRHYVVLVKDLQFIEGGFMDGELELDDGHRNQKSLILQNDCYQSLHWTDEDHSLLVRLDIS